MTSTDHQYFQNMYAASNDPWDFETSAFERRKYALTVGTLTKECYRNAFEPGCSVGVLSELLSSRCERLLVTDIIPSALARASVRLEPYVNVVVEQRAIPESWPNDTFDLVVLSELAYYFDAETLRKTISLVARSTERGGHVLGVHWRGETDYPLSGDGAHEVISENINLRRIVHHLEKEFVIDLWERA